MRSRGSRRAIIKRWSSVGRFSIGERREVVVATADSAGAERSMRGAASSRERRCCSKARAEEVATRVSPVIVMVMIDEVRLK